MDTIVKWYIEKALEENYSEIPGAMSSKEFANEVNAFVTILEEERHNISEMDTLLRALELAVQDIG